MDPAKPVEETVTVENKVNIKKKKTKTRNSKEPNNNKRHLPLTIFNNNINHDGDEVLISYG